MDYIFVNTILLIQFICSGVPTMAWGAHVTILFMSVHCLITDIDNGNDVTLTLNCTTNKTIASYKLDKNLSHDYHTYGWVTVEYTCTNSSSSTVSYVYNW